MKHGLSPPNYSPINRANFNNCALIFNRLFSAAWRLTSKWTLLSTIKKLIIIPRMAYPSASPMVKMGRYTKWRRTSASIGFKDALQKNLTRLQLCHSPETSYFQLLIFNNLIFD